MSVRQPYPEKTLAEVDSVSNADGTLTISPTVGDVVASLALSKANTWTGAIDVSVNNSINIGSDNGATTRTNSTYKFGRLTCPSILNAEENWMLIAGNEASNTNLLLLGGGSSVLNCATAIDFYTAADTTTLTGARMMRMVPTSITSEIPFIAEHASGIDIGKDVAGGSPNVAGVLKMYSAGDNAYYNTFTSGTNTANATYTLPVAMPASSGMALTSTDAGVMSWAAPAPAAHVLDSATHTITGKTAGQVLRASAATTFAFSTATYPDTTTANQILYSSSASVIGEITTGNSSVLVTNGSGVPSLATDIPTAVTIGTAYIYRVSGTDVSVADGGTGKSSWTQYLIPYADTTTSFSQIAIGTAGQPLLSGGAGAAPAFGSDLATATTIGTAYIYRVGGTDVAVADGGTGLSSYAVGDIVYASATGTLAGLAGVAAGQPLLSGGVATAPAYAGYTLSGTAAQTYTFPGATQTLASLAGTETLTNKRVTPRVTAIATNANPTINTDTCDFVDITAQAGDIASMSTNLSGTPTNGQKLTIRFKDNGSARAIAWGASYEACGVALPTTTVISKRLTVGLLYDTTTSKWGCVASVQEA